MDFEFQWSESETPNLEAAINQALGAASMCWDSPEAAGVFDSTRAKEIGDKLHRFTTALLVNEARLGFATTLELVNELQARAEVAKTVGESWPEYSTVGAHA